MTNRQQNERALVAWLRHRIRQDAAPQSYLNMPNTDPIHCAPYRTYTPRGTLAERLEGYADDRAAVRRLARTQANMPVPMTAAERVELRAVQEILREAARALREAEHE